jgi:hypothetical protein
MAGSWREILESARTDEAEADENARSGETRYDPETEDGFCSTPAGGRGFDEPELTAFLTRLGSRPEAPAGLPALGRSNKAIVREKAANDLLMAARASSAAPAPLEPSAPAAPQSPPEPERKRPRRRHFTKSLLAAATGLAAFIVLMPAQMSADMGPRPPVIEASRIRVETPSPSRSSRAAKSHHKRSAATRAEPSRRCLSDPDIPSCRWHRFRDRE